MSTKRRASSRCIPYFQTGFEDAWEALFERLGFDPDGGDAGARVLVLGAAGGVGSIAVQLARAAGLHVIGSASRAESAAWVREMGAHDVVDHSRLQDLPAQLAAVGGEVDAVLLATDPDAYVAVMPALVKAQGGVAAIVASKAPVDLNALMARSISWHWEMMFTRSMFRTADMDRQGALLARVAGLVDQGTLRTTVQRVLEGLDAARLREAHALVEGGRTIGKVVVQA